ncbi:uncharacterized protein EI90DRAFT_3294463 [Cantharellus anzutake]|uniref:uncharacterized protein n=1 Tax=Cantharellus anzutake TaxID=1750568 RepID=UPI0019037750|nr:uncharacterized protein EI90DRAFT_3294463 [Cantharellus anzutake]KAF8313531.1 hypothetical protein EI90DRAFT_3294463 [Cantharellus anzutake]
MTDFEPKLANAACPDLQHPRGSETSFNTSALPNSAEQLHAVLGVAGLGVAIALALWQAKGHLPTDKYASMLKAEDKIDPDEAQKFQEKSGQTKTKTEKNREKRRKRRAKARRAAKDYQCYYFIQRSWQCF